MDFPKIKVPPKNGLLCSVVKVVFILHVDFLCLIHYLGEGVGHQVVSKSQGTKKNYKSRPEFLEAWLALTSVKHHRNA